MFRHPRISVLEDRNGAQSERELRFHTGIAKSL